MAPSPIAVPPESLTSFDGTDFVDVEALEQANRVREAQRFYSVSDGQGGRQLITAGQLGMAEPPPVESPVRTLPADRFETCPDDARTLAWLRALTPVRGEELLDFPVMDPDLSVRRRYAGYRMPFPSRGATSAQFKFLSREGRVPDVVILIADQELRPRRVVNNIGTESIPESLFRYAMVTLEVPLGEIAPGESLVVIEGAWARKVLPPECRPPRRTGDLIAGQVAIRFVSDPGR